MNINKDRQGKEYYTVKRYAEPGESIIITEPFESDDEYKKGSVLKVTEKGCQTLYKGFLGEGDVFCEGINTYVDEMEYEVIVGEKE